MKKTILSITFLLLLDFNAFSHIEHYQKFNYLEYELFRNNKPIGYHKYDFIRENETLTINSEVKFKITKLGVDLYKYFAESKETYRENKFFQFASKTNQNKKEKYVNISLDSNKDELIVDGTSFKGSTDKNYIVGTWWNHEIVKAKAQISAISGRVIEQNVTFIGKEKIKIGDKMYNTLRFNFKSADKNLPDSKKLDTDIWYEENTYLWVKAAFEKTGYWEYRIKNFK